MDRDYKEGCLIFLGMGIIAVLVVLFLEYASPEGVYYQGKVNKRVLTNSYYYFSLNGELHSVQCWSSAWLDSDGCLRCEQERGDFDESVACGNIRYYKCIKP